MKHACANWRSLVSSHTCPWRHPKIRIPLAYGGNTMPLRCKSCASLHRKLSTSIDSQSKSSIHKWKPHCFPQDLGLLHVRPQRGFADSIDRTSLAAREENMKMFIRRWLCGTVVRRHVRTLKEVKPAGSLAIIGLVCFLLRIKKKVLANLPTMNTNR